MRLSAYSVEGVHAFARRVELLELGRVNVIAGPNNVGKSGLLLPLRRLTRFNRDYVNRAEQPAGAFLSAAARPRFFQEDLNSAATAHIASYELTVDPGEAPEAVLDQSAPSRVLFVSQPKGGKGFVLRWDYAETGGGVTMDLAQERAKDIGSRVVFVPPFRRVGWSLTPVDTSSQNERLFDGESLFADLLDWQLNHPVRLQRLKEFASAVLAVSVELQLSTKPATLRLALGSDELRSLSSVGSGIEQVLVIAAATAFVPKPILLLEEPEMGLHPTTQRRLVESLAALPDTMTFLTTHSPHILDAVSEHVRHFHVRREANGLRSVRSLPERDLGMLRDLGVRPSSVLQANSVIWVEGPSDAIYLRAWLKAFGGERLMEGSDFSFAFYGGSLLAHLSTKQEAGKLNLFKLNPSWFLMADSDREAAGTELEHDYLKKLVASLEGDDAGRLWVTAGKEVESYLHDDELLRAFGKPLQNVTRAAPDFQKLPDRLNALGIGKTNAERKAELAERVVGAVNGEWPDRDGLEVQVRKLVAFIHRAQVGVIG